MSPQIVGARRTGCQVKQESESAVAWFRAFLLAVRSGDDALRRLAQRELRALGIAVAPVPPRSHP